jgi:hypothetical protein
MLTAILLAGFFGVLLTGPVLRMLERCEQEREERRRQDASVDSCRKYWA